MLAASVVAVLAAGIGIARALGERSVVDLVVWTWLMRVHGAVALHAFVFLIPVAGVFSAGLILDEPVTAMTLVSLVLIAAGILLVQVGQRREAAALRGVEVRT